MGKKHFLKWAGLVLAGVALAGCQNNPRSQWQPKAPGPGPGSAPLNAVPSNGLPPGGQPNYGNMNAPTNMNKTAQPGAITNPPLLNQPAPNTGPGLAPLSAATPEISKFSPINRASPPFDSAAPVVPAHNFSGAPVMPPTITPDTTAPVFQSRTPDAPAPVFQSRTPDAPRSNPVVETQYPFSSTTPPPQPIPISGVPNPMSPVMNPPTVPAPQN